MSHGQRWRLRGWHLKPETQHLNHTVRCEKRNYEKFEESHQTFTITTLSTTKQLPPEKEGEREGERESSGKGFIVWPIGDTKPSITCHRDKFTQLCIMTDASLSFFLSAPC